LKVHGVSTCDPSLPLPVLIPSETTRSLPLPVLIPSDVKHFL
jgi:hypothetical protein